MDRGRKSVLRDERRREDVRDAAEANGSTIDCWRGLHEERVHATAADSSFHSLSTQVRCQKR